MGDLRVRISCTCLGSVLCFAGVSGTSAAWVTTPWWVVVGCGMIIVFLGVVPTLSHCGHDGDCRGYSPVVVPVLITATVVIGVVSPGPLTAAQVVDATAVAAAGGDPKSFKQLDAGTQAIPVKEFIARSALPADNRLVGKSVELSGTLSRSDNTIYLDRIVVFCCAADARRYSVELEDSYGLLAEFSAGTPVKIVAEFLPGSARKDRKFIPQALVHKVSADSEQQKYEIDVIKTALGQPVVLE